MRADGDLQVDIREEERAAANLVAEGLVRVVVADGVKVGVGVEVCPGGVSGLAKRSPGGESSRLAYSEGPRRCLVLRG